MSPGALVSVQHTEVRRRRLAVAMLGLLVASHTAARSARDALFLAEFGLRELALLAMGLAFVTGFAVPLFGRATAGLPRDRAIRRTYTGAAVILVALRIALAIPGLAGAVPPLLYVVTSLVGVFSLVQFWNLASELFLPREAKRSYALVAAGGILGGIAGGFLSGALASLLGAADLLLLSAALLGAAAAVAQRLWPLRAVQTPAPAPACNSVRLRGDRFLFLIATAQVLATTAVTLLDFQFKGAALAAFEGRPDEMAAFFGTVQAILSVVSLGIQAALTGWILRRLGLGAGLLALPTSVLAGAGAILFAGAGPVAFLALVSVARIAEGATRFAVDKPSVELLWVPVESERREVGKTLVDTLADRIGTATAGLLWLGLGAAFSGSPVPLHLASVAIGAISLIWIAILVRTRRAYVEELRGRLVESAPNASHEQETAASQGAIARALVRELDEPSQLLDDPDPLVREAARAHLRGVAVTDAPVRLGPDDGPEAVASSLRRVLDTRAVEHLPQVIDHLGDVRLRSAALAVLEELAIEAEPLVLARVAEDGPNRLRQTLLRFLGGSGSPAVAPALFRLVQHPDPEVADGALRALARLRHRTGVAVDGLRTRALLHTEIRALARELLSLGRGGWIAARRGPLPDDPLDRALLEEGARRARRVFDLLALLRAPADVRTSWRGIRSGTAVTCSASIELLDNLLDPQLRVELLPLLEADSARTLAMAARRHLGLAHERREATLARLLQGPRPWLREVAAWTAGEERVAALRDLLASLGTLAGGTFAAEVRRALSHIEGKKEEEMALTVVEKALQLRSVDVLQLASTEDLAAVARIAEEVVLEQGTEIYREGDPPDALFVVVEGQVRLHRGDEEIAVLEAGEAFGTWALFDESARVSSATTIERSRLLRIEREEFLALLADRADIVQAIFKAMVERLRDLADLTRGPKNG